MRSNHFFKSILLVLVFFLTGIAAFNGSQILADQSKDEAAGALKSLLKLQAGKVLNRIDNDPNRKSQAFVVRIPDSDLSAMVFKNKDSWYAGITFDIQRISSGRILTDIYEDLAKLFGTPELKTLTIVIGEKQGTISFDTLPKALQDSLANFKDHNDFGEEQPQVTFAEGISFFGSIAPPSKGALQTVSRAILLGSKLDSDLRISGRVGDEILTELLKKCRVSQEDSKDDKKEKFTIQDLSLRVELPDLIPVPFSLMKKETARKIFFLEFSKTFMSVSFEKDDIKLGAGRGVTISLLGKDYTIASDLTITEKGDSKKDPQWTVAMAGLIEFKSPVVIIPPLLKLHAVELKGSFSSDFVATQTEAMVDVGIDTTISLGNSGKFVAGVMAEASQGGKEAELKSIELSLKQDGKGKLLAFSDIPGVKSIPMINEFTIKDVSIGISPRDEVPDLYLTGTMGWKRGKSQYQFALWEKDASFFLMARASDFVLSEVLGVKIGADTLDSIKMPDALLVLSSPDPDAKPVKISELPSRLQTVFKGFTTEDDKVPTVSDGIALMTKFDINTMTGEIQKFLKTVGLQGLGIDGGIVFSGSISGLLEGQPRLEVSMQLNGFHFPDKQPFDFLISFKDASAKLFVRVDVPAMVFQIGLGSNLNVDMPRIGQGKSDSLTFGGEFYLNVCAVGYGVRVGGYRDGDWNNPFGIGNLTLTDTAFIFGIDGEGALEVGFGSGFSIKGLENRAKTNNKCLTPEEKKKMAETLMNRENASATPVVTKDISEKIGGVVNFIIARPPIPKKLAFYFNCSKSGFLPLLEANESLLQGIIAGPGVQEFAKLLPEAEKKATLDILKQLEKTSLIDLFKLRDLPLPLIDFEDLVVYFSTPGAILPGFKEISGLGFSLQGKSFLSLLGKRYSLNESEITLTLSKGLILKSSGPVLDFGPFKMSDNIIDIHAGIPIIHGDDVPHFTISGNGQMLFYAGSVLAHLGLDSIILSASADFGPFGKTSFEARSQGKDLLHPTDFTFNSQLSVDVNGGIKEEVKKQLLGTTQKELTNAKSVYDKALAAVKKLNQDIDKARQDALKRQETVSQALIDAQQLHVDALQKTYDALAGQLKDFESKWYKRKAAGLIRLAMKPVAADLDAARQLLEKSKSAAAAAQSMVDLDPVVAGLLLTRTAAVSYLDVADVSLRALQDLQNQLTKGVDTLLATVFNEKNLTIRKLELSAATIKQGGEVSMDQDMTVFGTDIKENFKLTGNDIKAVIIEITNKVTAPIIEAVKSDFHDRAAAAKQAFNPDDIAIKPGDISTVVQAVAMPGTAAPEAKTQKSSVKIMLPKKLDFGSEIGVINLDK